MGRRPRLKEWFDTELAELPEELRWREWMGRVEAVIFSSPTPVSREALARVVGPDCNLDLLIDDIRAELTNRPYDLVAVAGGFQHRTRKRFAETIRLVGLADGVRSMSQLELLVLAAIAYYQPISRGGLSEFLGREVSRDLIGRLRSLHLIAAGPRSPRPGAPYTFVTSKGFLAQFGLDTLRDLPDVEQLEEAGLLSKGQLMANDFPAPREYEADEGMRRRRGQSRAAGLRMNSHRSEAAFELNCRCSTRIPSQTMAYLSAIAGFMAATQPLQKFVGRWRRIRYRP